MHTRSIVSGSGKVGGASARRGSAVFMVMVMTMALAALAGSAVMMTSGARLVSTYHNQERDLRFGAEAALTDGASDLSNNPYTLPESGYVKLTSNAQLFAADNTPVPGVVYDLYAGPTGSATRQQGRFVTLVAIAKDTARQRMFVRREELNQETFARFAYFSNSESGICFGSNDRLNGPVFSNDIITTCGAPQKADFMDSVYTPQTFVNGDPALDTLYRGWTKVAKPLQLPSTANLAGLFPLAAAGNAEFFTPNVATDSTSTLRSRIEFVAYDLNGDADSTNPGEGFVRFYQVDEATKVFMPPPLGAWTAAQRDSVTFSYLRSGLTRQHDVNNCGEWRGVYDDNGNFEWEFFPIAVHHTAWYKTIVGLAVGPTVPPAVAAANNFEVSGVPAPADTITVAGMAHNPLRNGDSSHPPRCYPGGAPELVASERDTTPAAPLRTGAQYGAFNWTYGRRGGTDTTWTGGDVTDPAHPTRMGHWLSYPGATPGVFTAAFKATHPDWAYLFPIDKTYNPNFKGVIAVHGSVGVSGVVQGHVTMYSDGSVGILDNLRLSDDADTTCKHLIGIVAGNYISPTDNGVNAPGGDNTVRINMRGSSSDLWVESTVFSLTSWGVEGLVPDAGALFVPLQQPCNGQLYARGCLHVQGSIIQDTRHTVNSGNGTTTGYGYAKAYNYDVCAAVNPLPYFPATGRYTVNNYYESDPVHFNVAALFAALKAP
jgi:Tfp pilus assembly protein PilX